MSPSCSVGGPASYLETRNFLCDFINVCVFSGEMLDVTMNLSKTTDVFLGLMSVSWFSVVTWLNLSKQETK